MCSVNKVLSYHFFPTIVLKILKEIVFLILSVFFLTFNGDSELVLAEEIPSKARQTSVDFSRGHCDLQ